MALRQQRRVSRALLRQGTRSALLVPCSPFLLVQCRQLCVQVSRSQQLLLLACVSFGAREVDTASSQDREQHKHTAASLLRQPEPHGPLCCYNAERTSPGSLVHRAAWVCRRGRVSTCGISRRWASQTPTTRMTTRKPPRRPLFDTLLQFTHCGVRCQPCCLQASSALRAPGEAAPSLPRPQ